MWRRYLTSMTCPYLLTCVISAVKGSFPSGVCDWSTWRRLLTVAWRRWRHPLDSFPVFKWGHRDPTVVIYYCCRMNINSPLPNRILNLILFQCTILWFSEPKRFRSVMKKTREKTHRVFPALEIIEWCNPVLKIRLTNLQGDQVPGIFGLPGQKTSSPEARTYFP